MRQRAAHASDSFHDRSTCVTDNADDAAFRLITHSQYPGASLPRLLRTFRGEKKSGNVCCTADTETYRPLCFTYFGAGLLEQIMLDTNQHHIWTVLLITPSVVCFDITDKLIN